MEKITSHRSESLGTEQRSERLAGSGGPWARSDPSLYLGQLTSGSKRLNNTICQTLVHSRNLKHGKLLLLRGTVVSLWLHHHAKSFTSLFSDRGALGHSTHKGTGVCKPGTVQSPHGSGHGFRIPVFYNAPSFALAAPSNIPSYCRSHCPLKSV